MLAAVAPGSQPALAQLITGSRTVLEIRDGRANGPAADFLARRMADSSFFMIGEEHGVATIADTVRSMLPLFHNAGYRYFAVETDPHGSRMVEAHLRQGGPAALARLLQQEGNQIAVPFFNWTSEAALADAFLQSTQPGPHPSLWGLDQVFIGSYSVLLDQVSRQTTSPGAGARAAALAAQAKGNMGFLSQVDPTEFDRLRADLDAAGDASLVSLVDEMVLSYRVYAPFVGLPGWSPYAANRAREDLMKRTFLARYRAAAPARVLFKFGSNHMVRGLSPTHVPTLGSFIADLALAEGTSAFNLLVLCGPGSRAGDFRGDVGACEIDVLTMMPDVAAALDPEHPTLFDLAPWKDQPAAWKNLPEDIRRLVWGYDAMLVVPNGEPATLLAPTPAN